MTLASSSILCVEHIVRRGAQQSRYGVDIDDNKDGRMTIKNAQFAQVTTACWGAVCFVCTRVTNWSCDSVLPHLSLSLFVPIDTHSANDPEAGDSCWEFNLIRYIKIVP